MLAILAPLILWDARPSSPLPGQARHVRHRDERIQVVFPRPSYRIVERGNREKRRGRLHRNNIVDTIKFFHDIVDNGVQGDIVATQSLVSPMDLCSKLLGNNSNLRRVRCDDHSIDEL